MENLDAINAWKRSCLVALGLGLLLLGSFGAVWLWRRSTAVKGAETRLSGLIGQPAPRFEGTLLNGATFRFPEHVQGRPAVINVWATWCPPCKEEMPLLEKVARSLQGEVVFLAVNYGEDLDQVKAFAAQYQLRALIVLLDAERDVLQAYGVIGLPTTYFVDARGIIQYVHLGALDQETLHNYLSRLRKDS